ncbi:MAG: hypothetical protein CM1200mP18_05020 [Gammaproteobacteria bacterium]|nr:MAG: hypothetical protein CM1200mP18_05020 [Gammaproteobacteria bacterium]
MTRGLPHTFETYRDLSNVVISAEGYAHAAELVDQTDPPIGDAKLQRIRPGKTCSARDYLNARKQFINWQAEFKAHMAGIDALLTPTTTGAAIPVVDVDEQLLPAHSHGLQMFWDCAASLFPMACGMKGFHYRCVCTATLIQNPQYLE